jgi:hypothetical protein
MQAAGKPLGSIFIGPGAAGLAILYESYIST